MKISVPRGSLRPLRSSDDLLFRIEEAADCDGSECLRAAFDEDGELEPLPPHYHLIATGRNPDAGPRCYAVGGPLPEFVYESDHEW
jgi:hypothetical protein